MQNSDSFVDLRLNRDAGGVSDDSVWPSFTDVMTVIVMIFLMALVVILLRNTELVSQLREIMRAQRIAVEEVKTYKAEKLALAEQLGDVQLQLTQLQTDLTGAEETKQQQDLELEAKADEITQLNLQLAQLTSRRDELKQRTESLSQANHDLTLKAVSLENLIAKLKEEKDSLSVEQASLISRSSLLSEEKTALIAQLDELRTDFEELQSLSRETALERDAMRIQIAELTQERDAIDAERTAKTQAVTELTSNLAAVRTELNEIMAVRDELDAIKASLENQLAQANETYTELSAKNAADINTISDLTLERDALRKQLNQSADEIAQLTASLAELQAEGEQSASQIQTLSRDKNELTVELEERAAVLAELRSAVAELRAQAVQRSTVVAQLTDTKDGLDKQVIGLRQQLASTQKELDQIKQEALARSDEVDRLGVERDDLRDQIALLETTRDELSAELDTLTGSNGIAAQLEQARLALAAHQRELVVIKSQYASSERNREALADDLSTLQVRYDKLVRPARSPTGRHVVEIIYQKSAGAYRIKIREPEDNEYRGITREALDSRLQTLKDQDPERLYTRIIIPEESGLSYNEAWRFETSILSRYDYYHQSGTSTAEPAAQTANSGEAKASPAQNTGSRPSTP